MTARPTVLDKGLYALPWAWLLRVCLSYSLFAGPLPSIFPYPNTPNLCWLVPDPASTVSLAETVSARHCTRNTGLRVTFHFFSDASFVVCGVNAFSS